MKRPVMLASLAAILALGYCDAQQPPAAGAAAPRAAGRGRGGFGGPIELGPDDKPAFPHGITLAHLDKFAYIGMFSGGSIAPAEIKDMAGFKKKVKLVFVGYGSRENGATSKTNVEDLKKEGINAVYYESPLTAHERLSGRRDLHEFAPLLFQANKQRGSL